VEYPKLKYKLSATWKAPHIQLLEGVEYHNKILTDCIECQKNLINELIGADLSTVDGSYTFHMANMVHLELQRYRVDIECRISRLEYDATKDDFTYQGDVFTTTMAQESSLSKRVK